MQISKKLFFIATLLMTTLFSLSGLATNTQQELNAILDGVESRWAEIYYHSPKQNQEEQLNELLKSVEDIEKKYPTYADPLIWKAVIISTRAGANAGPLSLFDVSDARELLERALAINPQAMDGAAYVNLACLYYNLPGWPISFGDNKKAEEMFQKALKVKPDLIDGNYFYGDFLENQKRNKEAIVYYQNAVMSHSRPNQQLADVSLQIKARNALKKLGVNIPTQGMSVSSDTSAN